jgi:hypothetical protein
MAYVAERLGYALAESPIYFEDRRIGQSKMSFRIQVEAALRVWQVRLMHAGCGRAPGATEGGFLNNVSTSSPHPSLNERPAQSE